MPSPSEEIELTGRELEFVNLIVRNVTEALLSNRSTRRVLTMKEAMERLCYTDRGAFMKTIRRLRVPYSRLSYNHYLFDSLDLDQALERSSVYDGSHPPSTRGI